MKSIRMLATCMLLNLGFPALLLAQGVLENPREASSMSGITIFSGWVCQAGRVEISIDGTILQAAYPTVRLDTSTACSDDGNNGFSLLVNVNLLGDGEHTARLLADGVELAQATFTVVTLNGQEFVTGVSGQATAVGFPQAGTNVNLVWQESLQNFTLQGVALDQRGFTDQFPIADCEFTTNGTNRYFTLQPGRQSRFSNAACVAAGECEELEEVVITVLNETRVISFVVNGQTRTVTTRVVEESEIADGEQTEISRNYFAECVGTQDVYYFGEDVDDFEDGEIVSHDGAWLAGVNGAQPGMIMPGGAFLLGSRYFQEIAPEVALDRAEHVRSGLSIEVPAGNFQTCVEVV